MLSDLQAENEARLRRFEAQMEAETQMLQRLNEDAMRMRRLREMEDNAERAKLKAKLLALKPAEIGKDTLIEAEKEKNGPEINQTTQEERPCQGGSSDCGTKTTGNMQIVTPRFPRIFKETL